MLDDSEKREIQLFERIKGFDSRTDKILHSIGALAKRHDERMEMVMGNMYPDRYQKHLVWRTYVNKESAMNSQAISNRSSPSKYRSITPNKQR